MRWRDRTRYARRSKFDGNRWSTLHHARAIKQAARDRHVDAASGCVYADKRPEVASTNEP